MKYQETHHWISFKLPALTNDYRLWFLLGEASSKCTHLAGAALNPDIVRDLNRVFLAKGALATTAIEGNTLTEEQVIKQLDGKLDLPPSQDYLAQEVQNIIDVCNREIRQQLDGCDPNTPVEPPRLCEELIKSYNRDTLHNLESILDDDVIPGEYRTGGVVVGRVYLGAPAENLNYLMERLCGWLNSEGFQPPREDYKVPFALIKAIVAHVYLAWIHPFGDGNGRTARLLEFHILFSAGVPLPAAHLLSDHYNKTRARYYRELDQASKSGGDLIPFLKYALEGFVDGIRDQISIVRNEQLSVVWENYVHSRFRDNANTTTQKRRRDLVLDLTRKGWVSVHKIDEVNINLAKAYLLAGDRMLQRDLNSLEKLGLIRRRRGQVRAAIESVENLRPARVRDYPGKVDPLKSKQPI